MTKLSSLYGRTVALIAIVFLTSFAVLALAFSSISALKKRDTVRELEKTILMANSSVRDFIITRDPVYAKRTELMLSKADKVLQYGINSGNDTRLHTELHLYLNAIGSLIDAYQDRGFHEGSGLEGRMRETTARIEAELQSVSGWEAMSWLLEVRRSEKNYLLRRRDEYQDSVHKGIDALMESIPRTTLSPDRQAEISNAITGYQHDFDELVMMTERVNWIQTSLGEVRDFLSESLTAMLTEEEARAETLLWFALGLILVSFVFGILYAMFIAKGVVQPLEGIRIAARKLAMGDISCDFSDWEKGDNSDIAELARAFNEVAEQVRLRIKAEQELQLTTEELRRSRAKIDEAMTAQEIKAADLAVLVEELEKTSQDSEQIARSKSSFLASMSHEIRTPLNGIIGMTSLLSSEALRADQLEIVDVIRTSGESLLGIVNDILDFSKIEAGGVVLEKEPLDVAECIEEAMDMVSRQAADKGLDLSYRVDGGVPVGLIGDTTRVRQILVNLIANAVKFTTTGEVHTDVTLFSQRIDSVELKFSVTDTGIGIKQDKIESLFTPFSQAEPETSRKFGGTGLGLSIARHLAELMNGRMWADSTVGVGSTFNFTVQLSTSQEVITDPEKSRFAVGSRIILMNSNPQFGLSLTSMIESGGGIVHQVSSEDEARMLLKGEKKIDFLLINDSAEGLDGVAGVAIARALHEDAPECPIVLLRNIGEKIHDPVVHDCIPKPLKQGTVEQLFATDPKHEDPMQEPVQAGTFSEDRPASKPLRILLVEDNVLNQKVAVRILQRIGYAADVVASGSAAIDSVLKHKYDLIFMDVQMPDMDGLETTRRIRSLQELDRQPFIVALTANATSEDRKKCLESGMDDYASKPVDTNKLESMARKATLDRRIRHGVRTDRSSTR